MHSTIRLVFLDLRARISFLLLLHAKESAKIPILDLILGSALHMSFNFRPVLAVSLQQLNEDHILFECPLFLIDLRP